MSEEEKIHIMTKTMESHIKLEKFKEKLINEDLNAVQELIAKECDSIKELLLEKNKKYGNSVMAPKRIFSKQDSVEQIKVRIDDKLSRIMNIGTNPDADIDDNIKDLIRLLNLIKNRTEIIIYINEKPYLYRRGFFILEDYYAAYKT